MTEDAPKQKRVRYTQMTLKELRKAGFTAEVAEKWQSFFGVKHKAFGQSPGIRKDLFGFIDIIALREDVGILAIQTTSAACHAEHWHKILAEPHTKLWLQCGGKLCLTSWRKGHVKRVSDGKPSKASIWIPRHVFVRLSDCK